MTPTQLELAGQALYGDRWQSALARALEMNDRTMRRMATGEYAILDHTAAAIVKLLEFRQREITRALAKLR